MSRDELQPPRREDFEQALDEMGHVVDVSVNDLIEVADRARKHALLRERETLRVHDVMSKSVETIRPDMSLGEAADKMLYHGVSGLPVVDSDNRLTGLITEADLLGAIGLPCHHPAQSFWRSLECMFSARPLQLHEPEEPVQTVMTRSVITVGANESLHGAIATMKEHQVKRLVVIDDNGSPIGMVTRSNLVRAFFHRVRQARETQRDPIGDAPREGADP